MLSAGCRLPNSPYIEHGTAKFQYAAGFRESYNFARSAHARKEITSLAASCRGVTAINKFDTSFCSGLRFLL
jgi:hypothetical protein